MKLALLSALILPALSQAQELSGDWKGCLVTINGIGRCVTHFSVDQKANSLEFSTRTYQCGQKTFNFQPLSFDLGPEEKIGAGPSQRALLSNGANVGFLETSTRLGKITQTPDGTTIPNFGITDKGRSHLDWKECFEAEPKKVVCAYGTMIRSGK